MILLLPLFVALHAFAADFASVLASQGLTGTEALPKELLSAVAREEKGAIRRWTAETNGARARLEVIQAEPSRLAGILKEKQAMLASIFDGEIDPYFVSITKKLSCPERYRLLTVTAPGVVAFSFYSNKNYTYGACVEDLAVYHTRVVYLSCPSRKTSVTLEIHEKTKAAERKAPGGLRCGK